MSTPASRSGLRPMPFGSLVSKVPSDHYRFDLVEQVELANGHAVTVRPILPLDAAKFQAFVKRLSPASRNFRFLSGLRELPRDATSADIAEFIKQRGNMTMGWTGSFDKLESVA